MSVPPGRPAPPTAHPDTRDFSAADDSPAEGQDSPAEGQDSPAGRLPRLQEGARPQHLMVTLFGDYWFGRRELLPSAGLVALAQEFDISAASARAALSRLGRRGLLRSAKEGRRTFYGPAPRTAEMMLKAQDRIFTFGRDDAPTWDGQWLLVAFSVPEDNRDTRHTLRRRLRWLGFAPLYDGVWISAHAVSDKIEETLRECGIQRASVFRATALFSTADAGTHRYPLAAWDLAQLRSLYKEFIGRFEPVYERVLSGSIGASEALVERTAIMDTWRSFPGLDPELPDVVLPADWPRRRAYEIFVKVYDGLGPLAELRFRQILARHAPEIADLARHYTTGTAHQTSSAEDRATGTVRAGAAR